MGRKLKEGPVAAFCAKLNPGVVAGALGAPALGVNEKPAPGPDFGVEAVNPTPDCPVSKPGLDVDVRADLRVDWSPAAVLNTGLGRVGLAGGWAGLKLAAAAALGWEDRDPNRFFTAVGGLDAAIEPLLAAVSKA